MSGVFRAHELPDALRKYSVEPVLVAGWETRGRDFPTRPRGGLRHWTAGGLVGRTNSLGVVTNGRSDLPGPLCQVLQSREAPGTPDKAYVVAAGKANHAGVGNWHGLTSNYHLLGLEIEWSGPNEAFSPERIDVSERIMAAFLDCCRATDNRLVAEHREYATPAGRKIDTNLDGSLLRQRVAILRGTTPNPTPPPPPPPPKPAPIPTSGVCQVNARVLRRGDKNDAVKSLQGALKARAGQPVAFDGDFGPATETAVKNVQRYVGLTADGIVGANTWNVLLG